MWFIEIEYSAIADEFIAIDPNNITDCTHTGKTEIEAIMSYLKDRDVLIEGDTFDSLLEDGIIMATYNKKGEIHNVDINDSQE